MSPLRVACVIDARTQTEFGRRDVVPHLDEAKKFALSQMVIVRVSGHRLLLPTESPLLDGNAKTYSALLGICGGGKRIPDTRSARIDHA
jgi:hypothetical protein